MEARKIAEGEKALLDGAKCLRTSMLGRWKPDYEAAGAEYETAATAFRVAKALPRAIDAFCKASAMHEKFDSGYMAGKHLETAAFLAGAGGLRDAAQSAELYEKAAKLHQPDGRLENAAEDLGKAARALEGVDNARANVLAGAACDLYADPDVAADASEMRTIASIEVYKLAVGLALRTSQPARAAPLLRRQALVHAKLDQPHNVARCELSAVIVNIAADDFIGAADGCEAAQGRGDGFAGTDEAAAAEELLGAYAAQNQDALTACLARPQFGFVDNSVSLLARGLTLQSCGCPRDRLSPDYSSNYGGGGASGAARAALPDASAAGMGTGTGDFGEVAPEDELTEDLC